MSKDSGRNYLHLSINKYTNVLRCVYMHVHVYTHIFMYHVHAYILPQVTSCLLSDHSSKIHFTGFLSKRDRSLSSSRLCWLVLPQHMFGSFLVSPLPHINLVHICSNLSNCSLQKWKHTYYAF